MTDHADSPLLEFLLVVLASVMGAGLGDAALARRAAVEAIEAYQPRGQGELIATGRILAFAMAGLDTLRLSAPADLSPSMKLKLRGTANGLNRSAKDNGVLRGAGPASGSAVTEADSAPPPAVPPPPPEKAPVVQDWAKAMRGVAGRLRQGAAEAAPEQRTLNALWIDALTGVAGEIGQGRHSPPGRRGDEGGAVAHDAHVGPLL